MPKQKTHTLPIVRPSTGLRQSGANINRLQLVAPALLLLVRHRVRHHHPRQLTFVEGLDGVAGEDAVSDDGEDFRGPVGGAERGRGGEGAACVGHVVDEDGGSA